LMVCEVFDDLQRSVETGGVHVTDDATRSRSRIRILTHNS
jgi:hypothetical protein